MGPDRFRRIPSAKEIKKIGQHLMLATAILAFSARSSDAQSTPKSESLSNQFSEKHLKLPQQEFKTEIHTLNQATVKLSELQDQPSEVNLLEIPNEDKGKISSHNKNARSLPGEDNPSLITGYYCQYIPGYIKGDGGGYCGLTALGIPVKAGIAACGANYPLGVDIEIEGLGRFLCADRGYLAPNQIDIFFETNEQLEKSQKPDFAKVTIVNNP